ncbi:MAG: pyrroline-5-carboxylate reductase [Enhygromyxa sp.]
MCARLRDHGRGDRRRAPARWLAPPRSRDRDRPTGGRRRSPPHPARRRGHDRQPRACEAAEVVLVCLKPQRYAEVLDNPAMRAALSGKLLISIAAGVTLDKLAVWLPDTALIRAMPNTPSLIGEGMTVVCRLTDGSSNSANDEQMALARRIFESVGACLELEPKLMDAVTSLNGSGPAFVYVMLEAMADGGVMMGLPRDVALTIAAHVFRGAAAMVLDTDMHPAALKDQVTTPAGCTIAGILTMEDGRIRSVLARTIQEAAKVAAGLG